jgi:hypothetical protein
MVIGHRGYFLFTDKNLVANRSSEVGPELALFIDGYLESVMFFWS